MPDIRVEIGTDPDVVTDLQTWGFEVDLGGWRTDGPLVSGGTATLSTTRAHGGAQSMRLAQPATGAVAASSQPITVTPGRRYRLTVWLWPDAPGTTTIAVSWVEADGETLVTSAVETPILPDGVWTQVTVDAVAHPRAAAMLAGIVYATGDPAEFLYVDDVAWAEVDIGWVDITDDVPPQTITINRGRADEASQAQPMQVRLRLDNAAGTYTPGNATSPYYGRLRQGLPLRVSVDHGGVWYPRIEARVDEWAPSWPWGDLSRGDYLGESVVDLVASGPLRRLGQGTPTAQSAITRHTASYGLGAYWPMEDGAGSTQAASPLPDVAPVQVRGAITWAEDDTLPGSSPLPVLTATTRLDAAPPPSAPGQWRVEMLMRMPAAPAARTTVWDVATSGTLRWRVSVSTTPTLDFQAWDGDGVLVVDAQAAVDTPTTSRVFFGEWVYLFLWAVPTSSGLRWTGRWGNPGDASFWGVTQDVAAQAPGAVTRITVPAQAGHAGMSVGHLITLPLDQSPIRRALDTPAYAGEPAAVSIARLLANDGVAGRIIGDPADTERVAAQPVDALLPLVQRAADVDGGNLAEIRDRYGIEYRTRASMYNQAAALVLDGRADSAGAGLQNPFAPVLDGRADSAGAGLQNPFAPVLDDQRLRNEVTIGRDGGSAATVADPESIAASGRYADETTLAAHTDGQLLGLAGWQLHLGTWPGMRYPTLSMDLTLADGLVDDWLGMDLGDLVRVTGLPPQHPAGDVDLIVEGYTETITWTRWTVQATCSPGGAWTVAALPELVIVSEGFEDADLDVAITMGGALPWERTTSQAHTGAWALRSGPIGHGQHSDAQILVPSGATALSLWVRLDTEAAADLFQLYVDTTLDTQGTGVLDWTLVTVDVSGATAVTLRYVKSSSVSSGDDAVWVDDIEFTFDSLAVGPTSPVRADTAGSIVFLDVSETATALTVTTQQGPTWITSTESPGDFPFDIRVGGEVMRVTAITGVSLQTFTVTRSINGVTKPHPSGTAVSLAHPAVIAL